MTFFAATSFSALAERQIGDAGLTRRERSKIDPERVHATIFGVIESQGANIFDLTQADVVSLVYEATKRTSGWFLWIVNSLILDAVIKLVAAAFKWLAERLQAWIDRNKVTGMAAPWLSARHQVIDELQPLFDAARAVLNG